MPEVLEEAERRGGELVGIADGRGDRSTQTGKRLHQRRSSHHLLRWLAIWGEKPRDAIPLALLQVPDKSHRQSLQCSSEYVGPVSVRVFSQFIEYGIPQKPSVDATNGGR